MPRWCFSLYDCYALAAARRGYALAAARCWPPAASRYAAAQVEHAGIRGAPGAIFQYGSPNRQFCSMVLASRRAVRVVRILGFRVPGDDPGDRASCVPQGDTGRRLDRDRLVVNRRDRAEESADRLDFVAGRQSRLHLLGLAAPLALRPDHQEVHGSDEQHDHDQAEAATAAAALSCEIHVIAFRIGPSLRPSIASGDQAPQLRTAGVSIQTAGSLVGAASATETAHVVRSLTHVPGWKSDESRILREQVGSRRGTATHRIR